MDYAAIERLSALVARPGPLEVKLGEAAQGLRALFSGFDECSIYLRDGKENRFFLKARDARPKAAGGVVSYGCNEGIVSVAQRSGSLVEAFATDAASTHWGGVFEPGFKGFRTIYACPLKGDAFYGAIYLKCVKRAALTVAKKALLSTAAKEVSNIITVDALLPGIRGYGGGRDVERRLVDVEKLMALGDMAASLVHEVRNPVVSIGGLAARLKKRLPAGSPQHKYVDMMLAEIRRIEKIFDGAVRFLKDSILEVRPVDINDIIDDTMALFEEDFAERGIKAEKRLSREKLIVDADREQIKIAFDNIIANAIQSMDKGGTLIIATESRDGWIIAGITDTGGGIDPRHLGAIFNPFFTTKEHGTGLGLPITNSIVMRHSGRIEIDNAPGKGVTFLVKLPCAAFKEKAVS